MYKMAPIPPTPVYEEYRESRYDNSTMCEEDWHSFAPHPEAGDFCFCGRQKLNPGSRRQFIRNCPDKINGGCTHEII